VARLAIARGFLAEYTKLDKDGQAAVDAAVAAFVRHPHPARQLARPRRSRDDRVRLLRVDARWRGVVLVPENGASPDTYCLVKLLPTARAAALGGAYHG
jgi:hypothetical protein